MPYKMPSELNLSIVCILIGQILLWKYISDYMFYYPVVGLGGFNSITFIFLGFYLLIAGLSFYYFFNKFNYLVNTFLIYCSIEIIIDLVYIIFIINENYYIISMIIPILVVILVYNFSNKFVYSQKESFKFKTCINLLLVFFILIPKILVCLEIIV